MQRFYYAIETNLRVWFYDASVCSGSMMPVRLTWEYMQWFYDATEINLRVYAEVL